MRKLHFVILCIAIVSTLLLVSMVLWRKTTVGKLRVGPNAYNLPAGVVKARFKKGAFLRSQAIWANREFLSISDDELVRSNISALIGQLPLESNAKAAADQSCYQFLMAYSAGNWDVFKSVRIPSTNYDLNEHLLDKISKRHAIQATDPIDEYHQLWSKTFANGGLFDEVSFSTDSVSVLDVSMDDVSDVFFPSFTAKTNQNWMIQTPNRIFDYRQTELKDLDRAEVFRFFFFGKKGSEINPYMLTFVWDKKQSLWLPWRMNIALAGFQKIRALIVF